MKAQIDIIWLYRFFLLGIVALGLVAIVGRSASVEIDKKPIKAAILLNLIYYCNNTDLNQCINFDNEIFINYKDITYGNENLKPLCEAKEKKVKLKEDIFCLKTKIYRDENLEIFIGVK